MDAFEEIAHLLGVSPSATTAQFLTALDRLKNRPAKAEEEIKKAQEENRALRSRLGTMFFYRSLSALARSIRKDILGHQK